MLYITRCFIICTVLLEKLENCICCTKSYNERKLWNVVSLMRSLPDCRWFERGNKQSSKLDVATWIFPRKLGEFDRLPRVRTYARIRTATFDIFLTFFQWLVVLQLSSYVLKLASVVCCLTLVQQLFNRRTTIKLH